MANYGYIHGKIDTKLLILCFLSNLQNQSASFDHLTELSIVDGAVDYFDFCEALAELTESGHVSKDEDGRYRATAKGLENYRLCEDDFVSSVRHKTEKLAADVVNRLQRSELIHCSSEQRENGDYTVHMRLNDLEDNILAIDMMVASAQQAKQLKENFQKNAEKIYNAVLKAMLEAE